MLILDMFKNYQQVILTVTEAELLPDKIKKVSNLYSIKSGNVEKN